MRRGNNTEDYLYEDEEDTKAYASLPGQYEQPAAPPANVSPEMAEAMQVPTMVTRGNTRLL